MRRTSLFWVIGLFVFFTTLFPASPSIAIPGTDPSTTPNPTQLVTTASANDPSAVSPVHYGRPHEKANPFEPSPELRPLVDFWKKIYSQYTTRQAVLHDKDDLTIIYDVVNLDEGGKKAVRAKKRSIEAALARLSKNGGVPSNPEEEAISAKFSHIQDSAKFSNAIEALRVQLGQADRFKQGLQRSGRYMGYIKDVFRSYGLPEELTALPHVESSFNYKAYSSVGAAGIWQFMRGTGRLFMRVDYTVDERRDPISSTDAAARLLRISYNELGSWPLAITSYNHGINGMRRAKEIFGDDMASIIKNYRSRSFGFASRNFYVEFLAALEVSQNPEKYFTGVVMEPEYRFREIVLPKSMPVKSLAANMNIPVDSLKEHNLALRPVVWNGTRNIPSGYRLRVPDDFNGSGLMYAERPGDMRIIPASFTKTVKNAESPKVEEADKTTEERAGDQSSPDAGEKPDFHYVKSGETLFGIARKYGTTVARLASINGLDNLMRIRAGQKLALESESEEVEIDAPGETRLTEEPASQELTTAAIESPEPSAAPSPASPVQENASPAEIRVADVSMEKDGVVVKINGRTLKLDSSTLSVREIRRGIGEIKAKDEESLGHYAEWLKVSRKRIAKMNGRDISRIIKSGGSVKLPLPLKAASKKSFEKSRLEYHMGLIEDFFTEYAVEGEKTLVVDKRSTLKNLMGKETDAPPLWLLALYNPDKVSKVLRPGDTVTAPLIVKKQ